MPLRLKYLIDTPFEKAILIFCQNGGIIKCGAKTPECVTVTKIWGGQEAKRLQESYNNGANAFQWLVSLSCVWRVKVTTNDKRFSRSENGQPTVT